MGARTGLLTYALASTFPEPDASVSSGFKLASCFSHDKLAEAGALTVAGQWRSFTALPDILAIAVVGNAALY